ncbi:MAG: M81 family metallopeptidase [Rhodobacteraceae bacterium]|nr:M81 family metallopeptidase [Paracoccaceae bacterium]
MDKRVAVIEFSHETNTFSKLPTKLETFQVERYFIGDEIEPAMHGTNSEVGGFLTAARAHDWEPVFTIVANATPGGKVTEAARKTITDKALSRLRAAGPLDGVFIALHGAMVTETSDDGETQFLKAVREVVGKEIPIAVTFDLHANVFSELAEYVDIAISYRTYPHIDMAEVAAEACGLLHHAMVGGIDPALVISRPPMLLGCDDGRTTNDGPMCKLLALAAQQAQKAGILGVSINAGFTEADVNAAGPSVIVCYDKSSGVFTAAEQTARIITNEIWQWRDVYNHPEPLVDSIEKLVVSPSGAGPVVVADYSDNPGSGAYGDCTALIQALLESGIENAAAGALCDPEAVAELIQKGIGVKVSVTIGGKVDPQVGGGPLQVTGEVKAISDGSFTYEGPMFAGLPGNLGPSVCLRVEGLDIVLTSERIQMLDQNIFRAVGIEPVNKSVLAVKSMQHFRAAFAPIAREIIVTDAGGLSTRKSQNRVYQNLRRPVLPFDDVDACFEVLNSR